MMRRRRARIAAFAVIAALQIGGPFYRQVLHGTNPLFKNWVMYRGVGNGLVEASFFEHEDGRPPAPIDRFVVLGYERRAPPEQVFRITGVSGFATIIDALCTRLGPDADLRAEARLATDPGWQTLATGQRNLCTPPIAP